MTANALRFRPDDARDGTLAWQAYPRLRVAVAVVWALFTLYCLYRLIEEPAFVAASAAVVATVSLLPAYLWAKGYSPGLPILPIQMLTLLWTYAFPLVAGHPEISNYDPEDIYLAVASVSIYSISATAAWLFISRRSIRMRPRYYVLPEDRGYIFLVTAIFLAGLFIVAAVGQLINVSPGVFGIVRSSLLALSAIALFVLSARMARGSLSRIQVLVFFAVAAFYIAVQLTTIFLVGAIVSVASAFIGYTIVRGRVPWGAIVVSLLVFAFLHGGKSEMRERYWGANAKPISYVQFPVFFAEWIAAGAENLFSSDSSYSSQPIYERVSLMHMLLMAQRAAPEFVPYLEGQTYTIIPRLLIPRILDPDKPDSHQGTSMLNLHFGIQTAEGIETTTIGWGLLNEAYANFGLFGLAGLGAFLGLVFGYVGRLAAGAPVMSLETMIGVTFSAAAIQAEYTMAVFATVLFQSMIVVVAVIPFLQRKRAGEAV